MKLRKTEVKYEMTDESGYNFDVVCKELWDEHYDQSLGWSATVQLKTSGSVSPEAALKHLRSSAQAFLSHLKELEK